MEEGEVGTGHAALGQGRQEGGSTRGWRRQGDPPLSHLGKRRLALVRLFCPRLDPLPPHPAEERPLLTAGSFCE